MCSPLSSLSNAICITCRVPLTLASFGSFLAFLLDCYGWITPGPVNGTEAELVKTPLGTFYSSWQRAIGDGLSFYESIT